MIPNNPEHFEARQKANLEQMKKMKQELPEHEKLKLEKMKKCAEELKQSGIPFVFFAKTSSESPYWQFNHLSEDPNASPANENFIEKYGEEFQKNHYDMVGPFCSFINRGFPERGPNLFVFYR